MLKNLFHLASMMIFVVVFSVAAFAQKTDDTRKPSEPNRDYIVMTQKSLADLEKELSVDNKVKDLTGGPGTQTRVAIQHDKKKENSEAELHDNSDDVYYVLEGEAVLTLGGRIDNPREATPGEWKGKTITGGKTFTIKKGDLIYVPRGTPHQRNTTKAGNFSLILIKIFRDPLPQPK
jgi:mannose-6-phosphate isomerase-like protein (cupin superfamily)